MIIKEISKAIQDWLRLAKQRYNNKRSNKPKKILKYVVSFNNIKSTYAFFLELMQ